MELKQESWIKNFFNWIPNFYTRNSIYMSYDNKMTSNYIGFIDELRVYLRLLSQTKINLIYQLI